MKGSEGKKREELRDIGESEASRTLLFCVSVVVCLSPNGLIQLNGHFHRFAGGNLRCNDILRRWMAVRMDHASDGHPECKTQASQEGVRDIT